MDGQKKKILLVEDDVFMVELLAKDLERAGFEVITATTGSEGIKKFEENKPNLILLDILLPDQNGFDVLRRLRRDPEGRATKVMILSNIAEGSDKEEAKQLGVIEYLVKANYTLPEIVKHIQGVVQK